MGSQTTVKYDLNFLTKDNQSYTNQSTQVLTEKHCSYIQAEGLFMGISVFGLLVALVGTVGNVKQLLMLRYPKLLPANCKALMFNLCFCSLILCVYNILINGVYHPLLFLKGFPGMAHPRWLCTLVDSLNTVSGATLGLSVASLGAERFLALKACRNGCKSTDDNVSCPVKATVLVCWLGGVLCLVTQYYSGRPVVEEMCYCHVILVWQFEVLAPICAVFSVATLFTTLLYIYVYWQCRYQLESPTSIKSTTDPLNERYGVHQTKVVTTLMLPCALVIGAAWVFTFGNTPWLNYIFFTIDPLTIKQVNLINALANIPPLISSALPPWLVLSVYKKLVTKRDDQFVFNQEANVSNVVRYHLSPNEASDLINDMWLKTSGNKEPAKVQHLGMGGGNKAYYKGYEKVHIDIV